MRKWYTNGEKEILLRNNSPIPSGYIIGRLERPSKLTNLMNQITKETLYRLYIIENISFDALFKQLNISRNELRRLLTKYKITKSSKLSRRNNTYSRSPEIIKLVAQKSSSTQKRNWKNKSPVEKELWSLKQKKAHSTKSFRQKISKINKEYRQELKVKHPEKELQMNKSRSASCKKAWSNPNLIKRQHLTRKKNRQLRQGMFCRTLAEQKVYDLLITYYSDLQYDIKVDGRYPYYCDFYIPSKDLFIELQAHPSHGRLPIDMMEYDEYSKYPSSWADVFGRRDVEKLNYVKKNKLNFVRIYPSATLEENYILNNHLNQDIIDLCYNSQHIKSHYGSSEP